MDIAKLHVEGRKFRQVHSKQPIEILCADLNKYEDIVYLQKMSGGVRLDTVANDGGGKFELIPIEREGWVIVDSPDRVDSSIFTKREDAVWCVTGAEKVARITWQE